MESFPPKIDILPEHLIDQIKAGEVIERPGSLLKEILENAVDAGATRLELIIKNNGLDLISLKDNGHGMRYEDLPLAFSRHATSKINRFEDLYRLSSFGFRGEALASISAVSKLQCVSFSGGEGSEIKIEGGQTLYHGRRQGTGENGTELVIQDLFFNTPARLKFIQSQNAEKQFIRRVLYSFVLSNPGIEFQVKIDDREKEIFPSTTNIENRIKDILPKARDHVLHSERGYETSELSLYLIPAQFKVPGKWQYVFINGRFVIDKQFHRVMSNALQHSFDRDDWHYLAFFDLPADNIDVNVHPNKTVIKCFESSKLMALLTSTIKELAAGKKVTPATSAPQPDQALPFSTFDSLPSLLQERHEYNMEGLFSPHNLPKEQDTGLTWIGQDFFLFKGRAYCARKLLEKFVQLRLLTPATSIPLLVSEPYPLKGVNPEVIEELGSAGLEIEQLGQDTLVLRSIPEWMNGLPLKDIVSCLLLKKGLSDIQIVPGDWSSSTWEEMISSFTLEELLSSRTAVDLEQLLRERLK